MKLVGALDATELSCEVVKKYENVEIDDASMSRLLDMAAWRTEPIFESPGRTAWVRLDKPALVKNRPGVPYHAAKMKGVGLWNPEGFLHTGVQMGERKAEKIPPTTENYAPMTALRHVGINADGEFFETTSNPAPFGGILEDRAALEYENARVLTEAGVPSIAPLVVLRYPLKFDGKQMGAVITLSTEPRPFRAHVDYIDEQGKAGKEYYLSVFKMLGFNGDPSEAIVRWQAFASLSRRTGKLMHDFAQSGLYRYASQLENLHFDVERDELFLTDLDSSRKLSELPQGVPALQILRDASSALHKLAWRLHYFVMLDRWRLSAARKTDPMAEFVAGYFPGASTTQIDEALRPLWRHVVPHLYLRKRHRSAMAGWDRERLRTYEVDRDMFYALAMLALLPLYDGTKLGDRYFKNLDRESLREKWGRFLGGEKLEYLDWLEHGG